MVVNEIVVNYNCYYSFTVFFSFFFFFRRANNFYRPESIVDIMSDNSNGCRLVGSDRNRFPILSRTRGKRSKNLGFFFSSCLSLSSKRNIDIAVMTTTISDELIMYFNAGADTSAVKKFLEYSCIVLYSCTLSARRRIIIRPNARNLYNYPIRTSCPVHYTFGKELLYSSRHEKFRLPLRVRQL